MSEQFYTILTNTGKAKIANAISTGTKVNLTTLKVGDSNGAYYNPSEMQTDLIHPLYECNVTGVKIDKNNSNWITITGVIPSDVGGFSITEVGLFDDTNSLIAIGKYPQTYKPIASNGSTKELYIKMTLEVVNAESVELKLDPTILIATKEDIANIDTKIEKVNRQLKEISNPNLLINGDFQIWQRGDKFIPTTGFTIYTCDRWSYASTSIVKPTVKKSDDGLVIQFVEQSENNTRFHQYVEQGYKLNGKTVTLSFCVKSLDNFNRKIGIRVCPNNDFNNYIYKNEIEISPTEEIFSITFYIPKDSMITSDMFSISFGLSAIVDDYHGLINKYIAPKGNGIQFKYIKLELSSVATPFIPRLFGEELALCKRYFERVSGSHGFGVGFCVDAITVRLITRYAHKRVAPTVTTSAPTTLGIESGSFNIATVTRIEPLDMDEFGNGYIQVICAGGLTTGHGARLKRSDNGFAYIDYNAEIY